MALHDENVVWHSHPVTVQQRELHHGHIAQAIDKNQPTRHRI
ncbi:hypothetical protein ACUODJ_54235, partial [Escherichia sp. HC-CC]